jgi:hypothetical protein
MVSSLGVADFSSNYSAFGEDTLITGSGLVLGGTNDLRRLPEKAAAK